MCSPWSVVRSATYGYGHLVVHNRTHLQWDQLLDEGRGGTDQLWIIKDHQVQRPDEVAAGKSQQDGDSDEADAFDAEIERELEQDASEPPMRFANLQPPRIADM